MSSRSGPASARLISRPASCTSMTSGSALRNKSRPSKFILVTGFSTDHTRDDFSFSLYSRLWFQMADMRAMRFQYLLCFDLCLFDQAFMLLKFRHEKFGGCLRIASHDTNPLSGKSIFGFLRAENGFGYFVKAINNRFWQVRWTDQGNPGIEVIAWQSSFCETRYIRKCFGPLRHG